MCFSSLKFCNLYSNVLVQAELVMLFSPSSITYLTSCSLQYSVFGSILTIGGILGGAISGKLTDLIGRLGVSFMTLQIV